ncbi:MAG: hypothetical protein WCT99_03180 [Bacteroidota bacterium]|jgi:hypothetical protein
MAHTINHNSASTTTKKTALNRKEWLTGATMKRYFVPLVVVILIGWTPGCNSNPVQAPDQVTSAGQQIQLLDAPRSSGGALSKKYRTGDWFRAESGGELKISARFNSNNQFGTSTLNATFTLPGNALKADQYIAMTFDDYKLQIQFNPHGLQFNVPAKLTYTATGVDLSSLPDGTEIKLFYVNENSGSFEEMHSGTITYDKASGTISCVDGEIPHFSEYAFGYVKK